MDPKRGERLRVTRAFLIFVLAIAAAGVRAYGVQAGGPVDFSPRPEHVVMIMLDGFRPDYLIMYDAPILRDMVRDGAWVAEAKGVFPSMTTPNQTSFVTGAYPATHGIPNNGQFDRSTRHMKPGPLRENRAATIAEILAAAGKSSIAVNHFMLENRGVDIYVNGDIQVACALLESRRPALLVYYQALTDSVGHQYGPFSEEMRAAVARVDREIGSLREAAQRAGILERTLFVIASDHGMSLNDGAGLSPGIGETLTRAGFTYTQDERALKEDTDIFWLQYGSAFLYLLPGRFTADRYEQLLQVLRALPHAMVLDRETLRRDYRVDPEALGDIVVVPEEGYAIAGGSGSGGLHGRPAESRIFLLFSGVGVKAGTVWPRASIVDVVPTVLALLGVDPPWPSTVEGRVLSGILARPVWKDELRGAEGDLIPVDIAASGYYAVNYPSLAADGKLGTFWVSTVFPSPDGYQPQFLAFDLGEIRPIRRVELVARNYQDPVGPKAFEVWVGPGPEALERVAAGDLPPLTRGQAYSITLPQAVEARVVKLVFPSAYTRFVQIAEIRFWSGGGAANE